jgi:hypothetical protein
MPRRAVPGLALTLSPANVKDLGGKMTVGYVEYDFDVTAPVRGAEQVPSPRYPAKAAGISSEGLSQEKDSVITGNDSAEMSPWPEPEEEDDEPKDEQQ